MSTNAVTFVVFLTTMPYRYILPAAKEQIIVMAAHMKTKKIAEVTNKQKFYVEGTEMRHTVLQLAVFFPQQNVDQMGYCRLGLPHRVETSLNIGYFNVFFAAIGVTLNQAMSQFFDAPTVN